MLSPSILLKNTIGGYKIIARRCIICQYINIGARYAVKHSTSYLQFQKEMK